MGVLVLRAALPVPGYGCEPGTWNLESSRPSLSTVLLRAGLESLWISQMSALFHLGICGYPRSPAAQNWEQLKSFRAARSSKHSARVQKYKTALKAF